MEQGTDLVHTWEVRIFKNIYVLFMSIDSEIRIREFRIDVMMGFQPTGRTVRKSRGSRIDKDSYKMDISYYLRNAGKNECR